MISDINVLMAKKWLHKCPKTPFRSRTVENVFYFSITNRQLLDDSLTVKVEYTLLYFLLAGIPMMYIKWSVQGSNLFCFEISRCYLHTLLWVANISLCFCKSECSKHLIVKMIIYFYISHNYSKIKRNIFLGFCNTLFLGWFSYRAAFLCWMSQVITLGKRWQNKYLRI